MPVKSTAQPPPQIHAKTRNPTYGKDAELEHSYFSGGRLRWPWRFGELFGYFFLKFVCPHRTAQPSTCRCSAEERAAAAGRNTHPQLLPAALLSRCNGWENPRARPRGCTDRWDIRSVTHQRAQENQTTYTLGAWLSVGPIPRSEGSPSQGSAAAGSLRANCRGGLTLSREGDRADWWLSEPGTTTECRRTRMNFSG